MTATFFLSSSYLGLLGKPLVMRVGGNTCNVFMQHFLLGRTVVLQICGLSLQTE